MFFCRRGFTLQEALDIISGEEVEDGREIKALYIAPPESSVLTDEDSGDEDEGGLVDNLSGKQLLADAEIRYTQDEHEMLNELDITSNVQADIFLDGNNTLDYWTLDTSNVQGDVQADILVDGVAVHTFDAADVQGDVQADRSVENTLESNPVENNGERLENVAAGLVTEFHTKKANVLKELKEEYTEELKLKRKKIPIKRSWVQGDIEVHNVPFPVADFSKYRDMTACELFELFIDENLLELIEQETLKYALFRNFPNPNITKDNIKCFFAIPIDF